VAASEYRLVENDWTDGPIGRIRNALRKVGTVKRNVTTIRESAGTIQDEAEALQSNGRVALVAIEEVLRSGVRESAVAEAR